MGGGERVDRLAHRAEDPALADRVDRPGTFPEGEDRWMDAGERECHPLRAQLLLDLDQHVRAVGVRQVHGLGIDDDPPRRLLLQDELVQSLTEPIGVGKEERDRRLAR